MARKLRVQDPGAIYHVINRGDHRESIFCHDDDRRVLHQLCLHSPLVLALLEGDTTSALACPGPSTIPSGFVPSAAWVSLSSSFTVRSARSAFSPSTSDFGIYRLNVSMKSSFTYPFATCSPIRIVFGLMP